ncbi:MAG: PLP-dependent aminotransferase family protein [Litorimonas sp.]
MLIISINKDAGSLQSQIVKQIIMHIKNGTLLPSSVLPSTRNLSQELNVSRNTIVTAYQRLISEGYLETSAARETRVSAVLPEVVSSVIRETKSTDAVEIKTNVKFRNARIHTPEIVQEIVNRNSRRIKYDFWVGRPDHQLFPKKIWRQLLLESFDSNLISMVQYGNPAGSERLRSVIAELVRTTRGIATTHEHIIITAGIQEALNIVSRLFVREGGNVYVENPCYQGAAYVFKSYGANIVPIPVDAKGMDVSQLKGKPPGLVYTTPSHQYPTGVTLSLKRRKRLIRWAEETGSCIVEDDYDSDFRYDKPPLHALSGLSMNGHSIYLGTFSKSLGAGLRLGYMVLPERLTKPAIAIKTLLNNHHVALDQAVMTRFIEGGHFERHLRIIRQEYRRRRDSLIGAIKHNFGKQTKITGAEGGMHIVWNIPQGFPDASNLQNMALTKGVGLYTTNSGGSVDFLQKDNQNSQIIMGYSSLKCDEIETGVSRIASLLRGNWC